MNSLFVLGFNNDLKNKIVNEQLKSSRVLLITNGNIYTKQKHHIEAGFVPQEKFLNSISDFVLLPHTSMVFDIWDEKFNREHGQDVNGLILSLLGSFINNVNDSRSLIIDCFDALSPIVKKRVLDIFKSSKKYNVSCLIITDIEKTLNYEETLLMSSDFMYIPKTYGMNSKKVQSLLEKSDIRKIELMTYTDVLFKRKSSYSEII